MNIIETLNDSLLKQPFENTHNLHELLKQHMQVAYMYAKIENSIAVLSNLNSNKSYIYYGGIAAELGLSKKNETDVISTIWEDDIFDKIHPDDLIEKHFLELQFFHLQKKIDASEKSNYHVSSRLRMKNKLGEYIPIQHRMFYVCNSENGNPWLALCLYNSVYAGLPPSNYEGLIVNSVTGNCIKPDKQKCNKILSDREKEVLQLIGKGRTSKEIADQLSISKYTVDRHRQNILEKLRVSNSIEACRIAELYQFIP